jgi:hypothetical protein
LRAYFSELPEGLSACQTGGGSPTPDCRSCTYIAP